MEEKASVREILKKQENAKAECYYVHSIKGFYYKINN